MITQEPTKEMFAGWKSIWSQYKGKLKSNRKSGAELLQYLQEKYVLTEIHEEDASNAVIGNVTITHLMLKNCLRVLLLYREHFSLKTLETVKFCIGMKTKILWMFGVATLPESLLE